MTDAPRYDKMTSADLADKLGEIKAATAVYEEAEQQIKKILISRGKRTTHQKMVVEGKLFRVTLSAATRMTLSHDKVITFLRRHKIIKTAAEYESLGIKAKLSSESSFWRTQCSAKNTGSGQKKKAA